MRLVIADAGPLIGLARIGHIELRRALFSGVTLSSVVAAEIGLAGPFRSRKGSSTRRRALSADPQALSAEL